MWESWSEDWRREETGEELDEKLRVLREAQEHSRELLEEDVGLPGVGFVFCCCWKVRLWS